jgi:hypothetical protein
MKRTLAPAAAPLAALGCNRATELGLGDAGQDGATDSDADSDSDSDADGDCAGSGHCCPSVLFGWSHGACRPEPCD